MEHSKIKARNAEIASEYSAGATPEELADKHRLGVHYIRRLVRLSGVPVRWGKRGRPKGSGTGPYPPSVRNLEMAELYMGGMSLGDLSDYFNISRQRVDQIVKRMGLWRPRVYGSQQQLDAWERARGAARGYRVVELRDAVEDVRAGAHPFDAAKRRGVRTSSLYAACKRAGVTPPKRTQSEKSANATNAAIRRWSSSHASGG